MTEQQRNEDEDQTKEIELNKPKSLDWKDLTSAQVDERPERTEEVEKGKKQGGGSL